MKIQIKLLMVTLICMTEWAHAGLCHWQDEEAARAANFHQGQITAVQARRADIDKLIATKNSEYEADARAHGQAQRLHEGTIALQSRLGELSAAVGNLRDIFRADESSRRAVARETLMAGKDTSDRVVPDLNHDDISQAVRDAIEPLMAATGSFNEYENKALQLNWKAFDEALGANSAEQASRLFDQVIEMLDSATAIAGGMLAAQAVKLSEVSLSERQAFADLMEVTDQHRVNEIFIRSEQGALNFEIAKRGEWRCIEGHFVR